MGISATCNRCRRKFELDLAAPDPGRRCQYCGGDLSFGAPTKVLPAMDAQTGRQERAACPICGIDVFVERTKPIACHRCGTDLLAPEIPGTPAKVAPKPASDRPPFPMPCPQCKSELALPANKPRPEVACGKCGYLLTTLHMPLEAWANVAELALPGGPSEDLVFILRARWSEGKATAGEVARLIEGARHVTGWLQAKPDQRPSEFPLPPTLTAEILKFLILRTPPARIQPQPDGCVLMTIPAEKRESEKVAPALLVTLVPNPSGCGFAFQSRTGDGAVGPLADEPGKGVRSTIETASPRATFQFLLYRALFGDWIRPRAIACVPPAIFERELAALRVPDARMKSLRDRLST